MDTGGAEEGREGEPGAPGRVVRPGDRGGEKMLWAGQWLHQLERASQCSGVTGHLSFFHDFPVQIGRASCRERVSSPV